ncbi:ENTH/VHS family protein isoform 1 [Dorcoceras hygrometricum]|uniref:ENTH/VHS family protein isoform 1 n=1 Tax=Dorcoceras hygrometricum TaxID=472368 RepID=A0A2Z7B059_9LAMI|nr:ENTH/VHS family protein isoform 1 [Dorcoceras hygrometricum]
MKKAFGQTVRDIKREVNKKVLKVPSVEQKVLDATSNEPWGPHGLLLTDIAEATRNYHEYQMIMGVLWKRINDTGKNWRHVYKALTVLEYLVAHGSERVIDEIREHAYQISTLSDFQYIDSSGRDQGNNVRKKSQSLVVLVNDKERIQEVRQKAAANRDKYRNTSMGDMNQYGSNSSSGGYGDRYDDDRYDGRYGNRDDDRNGYRDDERYGRYGDGREGDKYSRDHEDRYRRDGSRDDEFRGRGQSTNDYHYGSRGGSADFDKDRADEDDGQYSSRAVRFHNVTESVLHVDSTIDNHPDEFEGLRRNNLVWVEGREKHRRFHSCYGPELPEVGSAVKADDYYQDGSTMGKRLDRKYSDQNLGAPPSYEEATSAAHSPSFSERNGECSSASAAKASVPPSEASPSHEKTVASPPPVPASAPSQVSATDTAQEVNGFDEFDPRGSFSATSNGFAPATSADQEIDLLGSLSESFSLNSLALMPATEPTTTHEAPRSASFSSGSPFAAPSSASSIPDQSFDDPFGDGPFKAIPSTYSVPAQEQFFAPSSSFNPHSSQSFDLHQPAQMAGTEFGGHDDSSYIQSVPSGVQPPTNPQFAQQDSSTFNQDIDILADILPPSMPSGYSFPDNQNMTQTGFPPQDNQPLQSGLPSLTNQNSFQAKTGEHPGFPAQLGQTPPQTIYPLHSAESASRTSLLAHSMALTFPAQSGQPSQMGFYSENGQPAYLTGYQSQKGSSNASVQPLGGLSALSNPPNPNFYGIQQQQDVSICPINMITPTFIGQIAQHNFQTKIGSAIPTASPFGPQAPQVRPSSIPSAVLSNPASVGSSAIVPQPTKDKFETKSTVWADTLSRGLVNLNISGPKANPLADIGVDFDSINRKEKRMEKPTTAPVTSTITMGKAMGSGSGMGHAGATALRPPPNPMMGSGVNMTGIPGAGMGMAGGYGVNHPMVRRMGKNMGMGQGVNMGQQAGFPPGSTMPGGYNPMMGAGTYSQRPHGGGY